MARSNPPMDSPFVAELTRRLQGQGPALAMPLTWIEQRLAESGWTIQQMVQTEGQKQAADQVSMSNSIGSLRYLSALDWRKFVESMSVVDQTLREDAGGVYGGMEFATRDQYRHVVEKIAKYSKQHEPEVARKQSNSRKSRRRTWQGKTHGARWLLSGGRGRGATGDAMAARLPFPERLGRVCRRVPVPDVRGRHRPAHVDSVRTSGVSGLPRRGDDWLLVIVAVLSMVAASQLAVALVNWAATLLVTPKLLPRMDFSGRHSAGVPHPGGGSDHALQPGRCRRTGRGARGALPRQPRRAPPIRPVDRFSGCRRRDAAGR